MQLGRVGHFLPLPLLLVQAGLLPGCGSEQDSSTDSAILYRDDAEQNCVPPGTEGNAEGIGGYCEVNEDCPSGTLCTGAFGAPRDAWFCTKLCQDSPDGFCGQGATCVQDARGVACVPDVCITPSPSVGSSK